MTIDKQKLLTSLESVPAFPASVHKILEMTSRIDCQPKELVGVIEHDPILTIKVLKLVNSAYFGLSREVTSIAHAVVYVGLNTIKNVAISVAATGVLPKENKAGLDMNGFWLHSLSVGVIGRMLARLKKLPQTEVANYFVAGLLHDIGKIFLAHFHAIEYQEVLLEQSNSNTPIYEIEENLLGISHATLGGKLAEKWELPGELIKSILHHHDIANHTDAGDLEIGLSCANKVANYLLSKQNDDQLQSPELSTIEMQWLGMSVQDALSSMEELDSEIDKAKMFIEN
ncbi:MAG: HDOD domain-containing protein [Pseudomonadales bacterium]|nr:HDOD domain-containing protein [Pseudomonadales bacterium]